MRAATALIGVTLVALTACHGTEPVPPEAPIQDVSFSRSASDVCPPPFGCFAITPGTEEELEKFSQPILLDEAGTLVLTSSALEEKTFSTCGLFMTHHNSVLVTSEIQSGPIVIALEQNAPWEEFVAPEPGARLKITAVWSCDANLVLGVQPILEGEDDV